MKSINHSKKFTRDLDFSIIQNFQPIIFASDINFTVRIAYKCHTVASLVKYTIFYVTNTLRKNSRMSIIFIYVLIDVVLRLNTTFLLTNPLQKGDTAPLLNKQNYDLNVGITLSLVAKTE